MRVCDFDYSLPVELIADRPLENRPDSRLLLVDRASREIRHQTFRDLPSLLSRGDLLVFNNSKVIPARLWGNKRGGGARIEILLLENRGGDLWEAIAQRAIRLSLGTEVEFSTGEECRVEEILGGGKFLLRFRVNGNWEAFLRREGEIPLPPYIRRKRETLPREEQERLKQLDFDRYQTTYAKDSGSAAAPTAGLHFDQALMTQIETAGIESAEVTLHVGLDTFAPVMEEEVEDHRIHTEWCRCPPEISARIAAIKKSGGRVVSVGTTTCRTLETYARRGWPESPLRSDLFLKPGDGFETVDALLTNFHLPKSTLLMLVSAFMGNDLRRKAYEEAIREGYRFYSYGDAMLIV